MKHLYIFEDGTPAIHQDPTPEDYAAADEGVLSIFRFIPGSLRGEIQQYIPTSTSPSKFEPVPRGAIEVCNGSTYHIPVREEESE